ncbi:MAG: AMP-binding protein [Streptosporangiales bacterium]|nr:AMP-binding protein [Streptosporangiales bacterium]
MLNWTPKTLYRQARETADAMPEHLAIVSGERRLTWRQVVEEAEDLSRGLRRLGIRKGDKVALWMANWPEWIITWLAANRIGAVLVPLNTRYKTDEVGYVLGQSDARALILMERFLDIDYLEMINTLVPELATSTPGALESVRFPQLGSVIAAGDGGHSGMLRYRDVVARGASGRDEDEAAATPVSPDDDCVVVYTSGTTGSPKGAVHSSNILRNEYAISRWFGIGADDRLLGHLPFFHVGAGFTTVIPSLITGAPVILMDVYDPERALRLIERESCTVLNGIPTHFIMMLNHPRFDEYDVSSVRTGWIGGSMNPPEVVREIGQRFDMRICSVYGMTETTSVTTLTRPDDPVDVVCETVGTPISDDYEIMIADPGSLDGLPPRSEGEIWVRGHLVMKGYYRKPDETAEVMTADGWFRTGDLGWIGGDGRLRITGRLKDMFIVGGSNVYPAEVENVIYQLPEVKQVYVVAVPDYRLGEIGMAFVELRGDATLTGEQVVAHCRERLANFKVPRHVRFVTEFPMTSSGKVQKFRLRDRAVHELGLGVLAGRRLVDRGRVPQEVPAGD